MVGWGSGKHGVCSTYTYIYIYIYVEKQSIGASQKAPVANCQKSFDHPLLSATFVYLPTFSKSLPSIQLIM